MLTANLAIANGFEITHPKVEVAGYDAEIRQPAGTQGGYIVKVKNAGDVNLDKVYLEVSFLPKTWYSFSEPVRLEIGETADIPYSLTPPADALGSIEYDLIIKAERGFGVVFETSERVKLITDGQITITPTQTTTTTEITETTTEQTTTIIQTTTTTTQTTTIPDEMTTEPQDIFTTDFELPGILKDNMGILIGIGIVLIVIIAYAIRQMF